MPPPGINVFMVAPKGPGHLVRSEYQKGRGVPCLLAIHQDTSGDSARSRARLCQGDRGDAGRGARDHVQGGDRDRPVRRTGGALRRITELIRAGYETLVNAGYAPEMAYFECLHEVKLIVDLIYEGGIANMRYSISNTAEYGDMTRGKRVIGTEARKAMKAILADVRAAPSPRNASPNTGCGKPHFRELRKEAEQHRDRGSRRAPAGGMMPWLATDRLVDRSKN